jgi:2'-5' RNA ligase
MSDTIRTFIAIELPENIISSVLKVQDDIRSYGFKTRWVRKENIHITLKFLGNINKVDVEKIGKEIFESAKEYPPLKLAAKGIGVFPGIKRPRVIWIGITGQIDLLIKMQKTLDKRLETIGFPKERRPFRGHLTIGRIKGKVDPQRLIAAIKEFGEFESETFIANKLILFKSELNPSGSIYTKLKSISLMNS